MAESLGTHWCELALGEDQCRDCGRTFREVDVCVSHDHILIPFDPPGSFECKMINCPKRWEAETGEPAGV